MAAYNFIIHSFAFATLVLVCLFLTKAYKDLGELRWIISPNRKYRVVFPYFYWKQLANALDLPFTATAGTPKKNSAQKFNAEEISKALCSISIVEFMWNCDTNNDSEHLTIYVKNSLGNKQISTIKNSLESACNHKVEIIQKPVNEEIS